MIKWQILAPGSWNEQLYFAIIEEIQMEQIMHDFGLDRQI